MFIVFTIFVTNYCVPWKLSRAVSQFLSLSRFSTVNPSRDPQLHIMTLLGHCDIMTSLHVSTAGLIFGEVVTITHLRHSHV